MAVSFMTKMDGSLIHEIGVVESWADRSGRRLTSIRLDRSHLATLVALIGPEEIARLSQENLTARMSVQLFLNPEPTENQS
jgi:hypothetical protein